MQSINHFAFSEISVTFHFEFWLIESFLIEVLSDHSSSAKKLRLAKTTNLTIFFFLSSDFGIFEEHSDRKAIELVEKNLQECRTLVRNITKIPVVRLLRAICYKHDNWIPGVALKPARRHCECCQSRFIFTQKVAKKGDFANEPQEEDWRLSHAIRSFEKKWYVVLTHLPSNFGF